MKYEDGFLILETEEDLTEWALEEIVEDVDEFHLQHDITHYESVFKYDDRFWIVAYNRSYENGIEFYKPIRCSEVEQREVTIKKWFPKEAK